MRERLLENWVRYNQRERLSASLCQALSALGQVVVHSTRHGPMEFGKDVISRDATGTFHAYQLKGNPGGRLTIGQWHEILPQINALMMQPVEPPISTVPTLSTPYLVTNGEVDEEVHAAIRGINGLAAAQRPTLHLIARGQLIGDYLLPIANELWPPSTDVDGRVLGCWSLNGRDFFPPASFHEMLLSALPFDAPPGSATTMSRALFGAAIVNEICLRRYVEAENHVATILGRALFLAAAYSLIEKSALPPPSFKPFMELMWASITEEFIL